jgi:uncharacterized protein (DUF1800 family)
MVTPTIIYCRVYTGIVAMKRLVLAVAAAALMITSVPFRGNAVGRFDSRLSKDQQILHALNRLTFGPRPGDAAEVRRLGVDKWIQLQLHPDQIAENPVLEAKLKPLETLRMDMSEIFKGSQPVQIVRLITTPLGQILPPEQLRSVLNGTAEQRQAALRALDPEKRKQVLAVIPQQSLEGLPELSQEAMVARMMQQEERQKEARRLMPPLTDLLTPDQIRIAQRGTLEERQALFNSLAPDKRRQVAGALAPQNLAGLPEMRREGMVARQPQQVALSDLREGKVYRALYSNRQLEEVLVDFWFNHFNVFEGKGQDRQMLASYERDAIRPHVLGHFKDLLLATARHPAMLFYLDNWESLAPGAFDVLQVGPFAGPGLNLTQIMSRMAHGLNENYGRELMELHTLGVDGGYTQQDVIEVARCFTGWTIREPNANPVFNFAAFMHDSGEKTVLGHKIAAGGGEQDGLKVIDILAHHPSTAKFISKQLARRFVADDPPQSLVDKMAQTFVKTDGDLRAVLETMFTSREFFSEGAWQAKVKTPFDLVVSAVRAMQGETTDTLILTQKVTELGEALYGKVEPSGYADTGEAWLSTAGLMGRFSFATTLAAGQIPGVKVDGSRFAGKDAASIARELLGRDPSPQTQAAIEQGLRVKDANSTPMYRTDVYRTDGVAIDLKQRSAEATPALITGLVISSPEFQRR